MRQINELVFPSQVADDLTSDPIPALNLLYVSAQASSPDAGAAGTLKFQASNDETTDGSDPTNWSDIPNATIDVANAGAFLIPKTDVCYQWIRLVYSNSGTGSIMVRFKAVGA